MRESPADYRFWINSGKSSPTFRVSHRAGQSGNRCADASVFQHPDGGLFQICYDSLSKLKNLNPQPRRVRVKLGIKPGFFVFVMQFLLLLFFACTPKGGDIRTVQKPVPAVTASVIPPGTPAPRVTGSSPQTAAGCREGSEPAIPELRACCRERNWGKACDGGCWAEGVGEKLSRMCNAPQASASDCGNSPAKAQITEWCKFHFNRRYCGVPDSEWIGACKTTAGSANPGGNDCANSPAKDKTKDWCNFHYNRRYCGISDSEWVQTCTPSR